MNLTEVNAGTSVLVDVKDERDAFDLVSVLAKRSGHYSMKNGSGKECVDAKSFLGVMYFMVVHPRDIYLIYEGAE